MNIAKMGTQIFLLLITTFTLNATPLINGNFATCDYSGWGKDTDGAGDISSGNDFVIDNSNSTCRAAINVDYFEPAGDPFGTPVSEAFFANTLWQDLDLAADEDSSLELTISFEVTTQGSLNAPFFAADYFFIGLFNGIDYFDASGNVGFLVAPTDITEGNFQQVTYSLADSFLNSNGWSLDFQLLPGWDDDEQSPSYGFTDALGSTLFINSVELLEIPSADSGSTAVSEPIPFMLFSAYLAALITIRRKK